MNAVLPIFSPINYNLSAFLYQRMMQDISSAAIPEICTAFSAEEYLSAAELVRGAALVAALIQDNLSSGALYELINAFHEALYFRHKNVTGTDICVGSRFLIYTRAVPVKRNGFLSKCGSDALFPDADSSSPANLSQI